MRTPKPFTSWLGPHFDRFVALRRACGAVYFSQHRILLAFDRWIQAKGLTAPLQYTTLVEYLSSLDRLSPRARDNVISVIWHAVGHALRHGAPGEPLAARPPRAASYWRERQPRIVSRAEIGRMMIAARSLPPVDALRGATIATLLGLLWTTGMRLGEAVALEVGDLNASENLLTIRKGKFSKSRVLVLHESTTAALTRYLNDPRRRVRTAASSPLLVSARRHRLSYGMVYHALHAACEAADIEPPWPRPHDLRHTFAITRVATWYAEDRSVDPLLPVLSTYLGHVSVENTRHYLVANGVLLEQAAVRFERATRGLEVLP